jgi:hypothetical protein
MSAPAAAEQRALEAEVLPGMEEDNDDDGGQLEFP